MSQSKVYLRVNRVDAALVEQAREVTLSDLHESMGTEGRAALMSPRMRPTHPKIKMAGPAVTAFCSPGDNLMMHRALNLAQAGDVLVIVSQAEMSGAQWGDVATHHAQHKRLAGVVVFGCVRDVDTVGELGFPVWATQISSIHPEKSGYGFVNTPVICDGVLVNPGDLVIADGDGVLVVPKEKAAMVVAAAQAKKRKEDEVIAELHRGAAVWDINGAAAIYAKLDVEEIDGAFNDR